MDIIEEHAGALVHHALEIKRGRHINDHIRRAKIRLSKLENIMNIGNNSVVTKHTIPEVFMKAWDNIPAESIFSGAKLCFKIKTMINRPKCYNSSILRYMRELRENGIIDYIIVGNKNKSTYQKYF